MPTSLEQLLKKYNVEPSQRNRCSAVCRPQQKDYVSLIQWFGEEKILPASFNLSLYKDNYRLIPYSKDTYGIYPSSDYSLYSEDGHLNTNFDDDRRLYGVPICIVKFNREEYSRSKDEYDKFWEWRNNRNLNRLKLEEEFSYDTKHAMHLVRLLRMGEEILTTGEVIVKRPDATELLDIRSGAWTYEELVKYAEELDERVRGELYKNTSLPKKPDVKFAAQLLMDVQDLIWSENK